MSLYLQRLLDRAAAAAPPPLGANPLLVSGSPILTFDQRLASAEMADDFSILGATPELPEAAGETPSSDPALARPRLPGEADAPSAPAVEPRSEAIPPAPPSGPDLREPDATLPELRAAEGHEAAPVSPRPSDSGPLEPPPRSGRLRVEPDLEPAPPVSVEARPERPTEASPVSAHPAPAPAEAVRRVISEAGLPDPAPPTEAGPVRARPEAPEARPLPPVAPPARGFEPPAPSPTPAEPRPAAEPIVAAMPPLAPPPRGLSAEEVERMIEEAIAAERERSAARPPVNVQPRQAQAQASRGEAPARRPATASEASLIGSLESSRFRPMLFGVRRR